MIGQQKAKIIIKIKRIDRRGSSLLIEDNRYNDCDIATIDPDQKKGFDPLEN